MEYDIIEGLNIIMQESMLPLLKIIFNYFSVEKLSLKFRIN